MTTASAGTGPRSQRARPLLWGPAWSLLCAVLAAAPYPGLLLIARLSAALYLVLGPWARLWSQLAEGKRDQRTARPPVLDYWLALAVAVLIDVATLPLALVAVLIAALARLGQNKTALAPLGPLLAAVGRIALPGWLGWIVATADRGSLLEVQALSGGEPPLLPLFIAAPVLWACFSALDLAAGGAGGPAEAGSWRVWLFLAAQSAAVLTLAAHGAGLGAGLLALLALVQVPMLRALGQGRLRWFSQASQPALLAALLVAALSLALPGA